MAFCLHCGTPLDGVAFCSRCGRPAGAEQAGGPAAEVHRFAFHGEGAALLGMYLVNFLLAIVTVGIYWFWGRTKVRRYLAGAIEFDGDRFVYHGTGRELLIGWLKAAGVFILLVAQLLVWPYVVGRDAGNIAGIAVFYVAIFALVPIAIAGAWRYRLSRTSYRGIRFSFRGEAWALAKIFYGGLLLTALTLGFYYPFYANKLQRYIVANSSFGDVSFGYDGEGRDLFKDWVIALLLFIPTLTLSVTWFAVKQYNYYFDHMTFGPARFRAEFKFGDVLVLVFTNYLLVVFTLFIGFPWAVVRALRFFFSKVSLEGTLQLATVRQRAAAASATGEGLSDVLDLGGSDLGMGM